MNLDAQEAALGLLGLSPTNLTPTTTTATIFHSPTSTIPTKRKQRDEADTAGEAIDCICGSDVDDGFSIACDVCSRWCHSACFDIAPEEIPDQFKCWTCKPRPASFKERAVRMQKERLEIGGAAIVEKQKRKASPGVERKHRRVSVDKRKRRPSVVNEDEHVDVDEPWTQSYVHVTQDIISDDETRVKLRKQAQHWRGVTAVADSTPLVKELPPAALSSYSNPHILPPTFSLHAATSITSNRLITDYKSSITPSSSYLSDPLNAYAHLGMPKPFVHLFGPPLDVALDSRLAGNQGRFARSGCHPNAVLRPLLCDDSNNLGFGVFALRDLKANEEVVLGWEWDDGNAVHNLPALLKTPHVFPSCQIQHLRNQMSNILHGLSSTFTTCACGSRAQDCAINRMAAFVDGAATQDDQREKNVDLGPLVGRKRGFKTRERIPFSGGMGGMVMCRDEEMLPHQPLPAFALSPSSPMLHEKSAKGKGRAVDGDGDVEMTENIGRSTSRVVPSENSQATKPYESSRTSPQSPNRLKSHSTSDLRPPDPGGSHRHINYSQPQLENEDSMPPKMRKRWMHRELEALRELNGNTSPSSSQASNHNHIVRYSESPGSSSASGVSVGSPIIPSSKLAKGSSFGVVYNEYGHERPQFDNENHEQHHHYHHREDVLTNSYHHPASMPPPPMPAFLDPTTISSTKSPINVIHTKQHLEPPLTSLIPPSISPLTSFANLSLLSPALLRSTPSSSVSFPLTPPNSGTTPSTTATIPPPQRDTNSSWSPLRRCKAMLSSTPPPPSFPTPISPSPHNIDVMSSSSSSSPPPVATIPANDADDQPLGCPSCTPSPSPSPSSLQRETVLMDTSNEIQSTPHSPDPTWRADSPSGDHASPCTGSDTPVHILNHDAPSDSPREMSVKSLGDIQQGLAMNEDGSWELLVVDAKGGEYMNLGISSSCSPSPTSRDLAGATAVDACGGHEENGVTTGFVGQSNGGSPPARLESVPSSDLPADEPILPLPQPDSTTLWSPQHHDLTVVVKEEEPPLEPSGEEQRPSPPPVPKVKMSLRDFALRKKKQREEQEMTKTVQDTPSSEGMDLPIGRSGGGEGLNEKVDGESFSGKEGTVGQLELEKVLVGGPSLHQDASSLSRPMVKDEVVDVPGPSSVIPITTNGYHHNHHSQSSSSPPVTPLEALLAARVQAGISTTRGTKQELIEQPIPIITPSRPTITDNACYTAMYNISRSISPINPDPHHFPSYSPLRLCQEDGEIGELVDPPPPLHASSSLTSSPPAVPPTLNRSTPMAVTVPPHGSVTPISRVSIAKRADLSFTRSVSSSSQVRHSPPTHPRLFNASPPNRQQPPSAPTPPPARGTGVVPPTAPRALRQYMLPNRHTPTTPTGITSSSHPSIGSGTSNTTTPASTTTTTTTTTTAATAATAATATATGGRFPPYIPRGPSADRDRGWDVDQMQYARSLSRRDSRDAWGGR